MAKKTTEELQSELQEVVKKHNEAQTIVEQCKTRAIQIQAIMEDRRSEVIIPDTPPAPPVAPPPVP